MHEKEDDLGKGGTTDSEATGSAGARLDCCTIDWDADTKKQMNGGSTIFLSFSIIILSVMLMTLYLL